jgi:RNA polymerase sigma factor (sigma-70 family)
MDDVFLTLEQQSMLTERICSGDRGAEKELVECFSHRVFALLVARTRDREAARDLFQEVMVAITIGLRAGQLREPEKLGWYIQGTARNLANNYLRGRGRRQAEDPLPPDLAAISAPDAVETSERDMMVRRALEQLDPTDQNILIRTLVEGEKPREIAQQLGLSSEVVRQRKSRAVKKVSEYIRSRSRTGARND